MGALGSSFAGVAGGGIRHCGHICRGLPPAVWSGGGTFCDEKDTVSDGAPPGFSSPPNGEYTQEVRFVGGTF